ncbi:MULTISPECIES: O-antigen ligase family protein [Rhodanobacteraceae]|uniref:O-antigen ligase family protein n=1 Tax=Rhodanobacteraceae TaxID=1775411 RepID=UPI000889727B|nr:MULTISPECIES: O-antigen ligase family protein [Rhodanobacteraceae]MDR6641215.1 O-antigen ligase [Luteibacter sp. 1214]SDF54158.1 O-antigen ligase [Dyella sp. 333MFSha]
MALAINKTRGAAIVLLAMLFVQIPLGHSTTSKSHVNVYHLLLLLMPVLYIPAARYLKLNPATAFIATMTATAIAASATYGGGVRSTLILFVAASYFLGVVFGRKLQDIELRKIFIWMLGCCLTFVILRDLVYAGSLGAVYARTEGASSILYMSTGGRNIEASLLALLSILLLGTRVYPIAAGIALLTSGMMLSRAGLVGAAVSIGIACWRARKSRHYYFFNFFGIAMGVLLVGLVLSSVIDIPVLDRFNLNAETQLAHKNVGRLALWTTAGTALHQNILGYGVGNGVPVMEQLSGLTFVENNVHNIYLQFLLEGGVQSLLLFLLMAAQILFTRTEGQQRNIKFFLLCYLMLAFIEFSGYEAYFWFFVGMFYARHDLRKIRLREEAKERMKIRANVLKHRDTLPAPDPNHA